ncbi:MAG: hypothetical protein K9M45_01640 [Kiritimatiellales bacterium]|nr:hypothetical protein [Kiritimatiellales bacterium]
MTPWESITAAQRSWLAAQGWNPETYNGLDAWQRTELLVEFKGGLEPNNIKTFISDMGTAAAEQVKTVATSGSRIVVLIAVSVVSALIVKILFPKVFK